MTRASYNDIAQWYDQFVRERPVYYEEQEPLGIGYVQGDAQRAEGLSDQQFTGCVCVLALITIPDLQATFQSVRRVLKPGGWLVFAIPHPCFESPHAQWTSLSDPEHPLGRTVTGYFDEWQWFSSNPDGVRSRVGDYHRMLSTYLNQLAAAGFVLERVLEPGPSDRQAERVPGNREIPTLLLIRDHLSDGPQAENMSRG